MYKLDSKSTALGSSQGSDEDPLRVHMASRPGEVLYAANVRQKRLLELADRAVIVAREVQADPARQRSNPFG